jgi:transposase
MSSTGLFGDLPETDAIEPAAGAARLREPVRDQIELRAVDLEAVLGPGHPARVIWDYVQQLDLRELEERVRARRHTPGQAPASPRLVLALWLFATSQGIGSARALDRLCKTHDAYRWLCGGVSMNYHGLSDFRVTHPDLLDRLLTENVATLSMAGAIDLDEVIQDGCEYAPQLERVRSAARRSFIRSLRKPSGWLSG